MKLFPLHLVLLSIFGVTGLFYSQQQHPGNAPSKVVSTSQTTPDKPACTAIAAPQVVEDPAQTSTSWSNQFDQSLSFIENQGQFDGRNPLTNSKILYGIDDMPTQIFFTKQGVMYRFDKLEKKDEQEEWKDRSKEHELEEDLQVLGKESYVDRDEQLHWSDFLYSFWIDANPNVQILSQEETSHYYSYAVYKADHEDVYNLNNLKGYQKLVYKDLYPGIDVEYTLHSKGGIKYAIIVHPGADISQVKMQYPANRKLHLDAEGNILVDTRFGDIIEHAPVTFYEGNTQNTINSKYVLNGNTISFDLGNYDKNQTIVIDPWVQSPTFGAAHCVWECDKDATGNVYVIGGDSPMKLKKYNSSGVLQWTYNTPWDTAGYWLGGMATDLNGNSYVTSGSAAAMQRINTSGGLDWNKTGGAFDEYWTITFNCDQSKMIVGGTDLGLLPPGSSKGVIFDINTSNGNVLNRVNVTRTRTDTLIVPIFGPTPLTDINEVRAITSSKNAKYFYLTLDTIGAINQNVTICSNVNVFKRNSSYNFGYKSEFYRPDNGNAGICAMRANDQFVYTQDGVTVHKRSLSDGSILGSAAIPGGITTSNATSGQPQTQPGNNGVAIDDCGNVYVGSGDRVVKYDGNLNLITSVTVPFHVYDVEVSLNGEVIAVGGTGVPGDAVRLGYVQSINMSACAPFPLVCCITTICPTGPFCNTDPPTTITVEQPGGVFSGPGITDANAGVFDPSVAGPGLHTIVYTLPCGSDSTFIQVNLCDSLEVCEELNGDLTVSGGTGPYTWEQTATTVDCSSCLFLPCPSLCPGVSSTGWGPWTTGVTVDPSSATFPIRVTDSYGNSLTLNSVAGIQPCAVCPNIISNIDSQTDITCTNPTGSASISSTGGTGPYSYNWTPGNLNGASQTGLAAGSYTVIATDANSCKDTITVVITSSGNIPTVNVTTQPTSCGQDNGSATANASNGATPYTYAWSPGGGNTATINNLAAGSYTVTVTGSDGCSATASGTVASSTGVTLSLSNPTNPTCAGNDGSITVGLSGGTAPYTVVIDTGGTPINLNVPTAISQTVTGLNAGSVVVTVADANGCTDSDSATLVAPTNCCTHTVSAVLSQPSCGQNNGSIQLTTANGSGNYSYTWANAAGTGTTATGLGAGTYAVTITDNGFTNCFIDTSFTLNSNSTLSLTLSNPVNPTCALNDGSITVDLSGGTAPYTVTIDTGGTPFTVTLPVAISQTFNNLSAGSVSVSVIDDQGCQASTSASLTAPTNCCTFTVSAALTPPNCAQSDGEITLTVANGSGHYTYLWGNTSTSNTISNLLPGTYSVTVSDTLYGNCFIDTSFTLNSNSSLNLSLTNPNDPSCAGNDGSVTASITGGTAPYTVNIDTGGTPIVLNVPTSGSQTITGLSAGTISVDVFDAAGCQSSAFVVLNAATNCCTHTISAVLTDPDCGIANGSIVLTTTNGSGNYSYVWSTAGTDSAITNLIAGTYNVTITDNGFANCFIDTSFTLTNPNAPSISNVSQADVSCNGNSDGSIDITITGGTPGYIPGWSNGDTTEDISSLPGGTYSVTITDANNCQVTGTYSIIEPAQLSLSMSATAINCTDPNSGEASVSVSGGTASYSYAWSNTGNTATITSLPIGTYTVTVTDAQGCIAIDSVEVTGNTISSFDLGADHYICNGDTATLGAGLAGTVWSTGDTADFINVTASGVYWASISSGNCSASDTIEVFVQMIPDTPQLNVTDTSLCDDETLILRVENLGAYTYFWSTSDTADQIIVDTTGVYIVTAANNCGTATNEAVVTDENCNCRLYMPNAFSPNGDNNNELFGPVSACTNVEAYSFTIFDRWGGIVFRSHNFGEMWDGTSKGKDCTPGVYVYNLNYSLRENGFKRLQNLKGSVTLIR